MMVMMMAMMSRMVIVMLIMTVRLNVRLAKPLDWIVDGHRLLTVAKTH